ncbi:MULTISPECIES: deaminase domain-containing protein [unclassified Microcoleus]|uniref:deaminase domain-containing protein n=1 Tax=unclassified Microcoleus TaxID=2642155 RepID=UPI002FD1D399
MKKNLTTGSPYRNTLHYEYPQDIPESYADIVEELRTKALEVRSICIKKIDSGNAAAAKLELATGGVYRKEATSKKKPINIPGENSGPKLFFEPRIDRASLNNNYNEKHAEYKLFNALAGELEGDSVPSDATGRLYLYTEMEMCSGCNTTCDEDFGRLFPNIQVIIFYKEPYP